MHRPSRRNRAAVSSPNIQVSTNAITNSQICLPVTLPHRIHRSESADPTTAIASRTIFNTLHSNAIPPAYHMMGDYFPLCSLMVNVVRPEWTMFLCCPWQGMEGYDYFVEGQVTGITEACWMELRLRVGGILIMSQVTVQALSSSDTFQIRLPVSGDLTGNLDVSARKICESEDDYSNSEPPILMLGMSILKVYI